MSEDQSLVPAFQHLSSKTPAERRMLIQRLQNEMSKLPQAELPLKHHFSKDVYAREILIPKGTLLVGKIHKYENLNIISQGDISVLTEEGVKRIRAPFALVSKPGTKRVGFAHEDTVWTTIHGTDERDVEKIEEEFIAKSYDDVVVEAAMMKETEGALWLGQ